MTLSNGSPLPHGIGVVSGSTMELPSTDAAIPLSASSVSHTEDLLATKTLDNAHGNVSGARILDNAAATRSSS